MLTTQSRWALPGLFAFLLLACGITWLLPDWEQDLAGPYHIEHFTFVSQDGQSLYDINLDTLNTHRLHVQQLTLTGETQQQFSFPIPQDLFGANQLVRTGEDRFVLLGSTSDTLIFVNPASQTHWIAFDAGLTANQRLYLDDLYYSAGNEGTDDRLVFLGTRVDNVDDYKNRTYHRLMGVISLQGILEQSEELAEFTESTSLAQDSNGDFILAANESGADRSTFVRFNRNLEEVSRREQDFRIQSQAGFMRDHFIAYVEYPAGLRVGYQALDRDGTPAAPVQLPDGFGTRFVDTADGFFTVTEGVGALPFGTPVVCYFGRDFSRQWCNEMTFIKGDFILIEQAQLLDSSTLLLTVSTQNEKFVRVDLNTEVAPESIESGLEVVGEHRKELLHVAINSQGRRVAHAQAEPYWHKGRVTLCSLFSFCIEPEQTHAGACNHGGTVVMPLRNVYTVTGHCELNSGAWTPRLLHWAP